MQSRVSAASSRGFLLPSYKDLKMVPSFSLSLSLSVSQMAILLTAAKKTLQAPVHSSPGMFVDLFESQPFPSSPICRSVLFKLIGKRQCFTPGGLSASVSAQSAGLARACSCSRVTPALLCGAVGLCLGDTTPRPLSMPYVLLSCCPPAFSSTNDPLVSLYY